MTRNCRKMIEKTADSLLCPLHSIQFSPQVFFPLCIGQIYGRDFAKIGNGIVYSEIFNSEGKSDLKHWTTVLDGQFRFPCCQFWTVYPQTLVFYNLLQYVPSETQEQQ